MIHEKVDKITTYIDLFLSEKKLDVNSKPKLIIERKFVSLWLRVISKSIKPMWIILSLSESLILPDSNLSYISKQKTGKKRKTVNFLTNDSEISKIMFFKESKATGNDLDQMSSSTHFSRKRRRRRK